MRSSWQKVIESILRPARPHLERCVAERESHLAERRVRTEQRARAIKDCEQRIEFARAAVFAANDGVIPAAMTDLEREWRRLSRPERDDAWMNLWARIVPPSWLDHKPWRDTDGDRRLDAAIALASDVEGVEAAESAIRALRSALAPWGIAIGSRVRFRLGEQDSAHAESLLAAPFGAARAAATLRGDADVIFERARRFETDVYALSVGRFPARPLLAKDVAHAALLDFVWTTVEPAFASPVAALRALWSTGYVLAAIDDSEVTLEIPSL